MKFRTYVSMSGKKINAIYPGCCQSLSCGATECGTCRNKSILDEFKQWVKDHNAVIEDPIWCPCIYTADV